MVLGTVGYMSPEQARGETVDHRSDLFALGAVLYEMLTGRRAFHGDTAVETLNAILKEEPEEFAPELKVPPALDRVVRHCLEKKREDRFQSARDVAFALEALGSGSQPTAATVALPRRRRWLRVLAAVAGAAALTALGLLAGRPLWEKPQPTFRQLTFRRGWADFARFAPDGRTVIYGAAWDGEPTELFMTRTDSPESRPLGLKYAKVLSISGDGRMLVLLDPTRGGGNLQLGHARRGAAHRRRAAGDTRERPRRRVDTRRPRPVRRAPDQRGGPHRAAPGSGPLRFELSARSASFASPPRGPMSPSAKKGRSSSSTV